MGSHLESARATAHLISPYLVEGPRSTLPLIYMTSA
jgi:hypothetical protein